jgi:hypothetical protein
MKYVEKSGHSLIRGTTVLIWYLPEWRKTAKTISQDSWSLGLSSYEALLNTRRTRKL